MKKMIEYIGLAIQLAKLKIRGKWLSFQGLILNKTNDWLVSHSEPKRPFYIELFPDHFYWIKNKRDDMFVPCWVDMDENLDMWIHIWGNKDNFLVTEMELSDYEFVPIEEPDHNTTVARGHI